MSSLIISEYLNPCLIKKWATVLNFRVTLFSETQFVFSSFSNLSFFRIHLPRETIKIPVLRRGHTPLSFRINPLASEVHEHNAESLWGQGGIPSKLRFSSWSLHRLLLYFRHDWGKMAPAAFRGVKVWMCSHSSPGRAALDLLAEPISLTLKFKTSISPLFSLVLKNVSTLKLKLSLNSFKMPYMNPGTSSFL